MTREACRGPRRRGAASGSPWVRHSRRAGAGRGSPAGRPEARQGAARRHRAGGGCTWRSGNAFARPPSRAPGSGPEPRVACARRPGPARGARIRRGRVSPPVRHEARPRNHRRPGRAHGIPTHRHCADRAGGALQHPGAQPCRLMRGCASTRTTGRSRSRSGTTASDSALGAAALRNRGGSVSWACESGRACSTAACSSTRVRAGRRRSRLGCRAGVRP